MGMSAAFISTEGWQAVLATIDDLGPYLILGLCILLFWSRVRLSKYEAEQERRSDEENGYGFAEDPSSFENDLPDRASASKNVGEPAKIEGRRKGLFKKRGSFLRRFSDLFTFLGLIGSAVGIGLSLMPQLYGIAPYRPAPPKGVETALHDTKIIAANQHRERGDTESAMRANREAMALSNIPIDDNAVPMVNIAEMLIEQGQIDRAYWLASIAAGLRSDDPDFVNPFAHVLIETCELDDAVDWLDDLQDFRDKRSVQLLELANVRRPDCSER